MYRPTFKPYVWRGQPEQPVRLPRLVLAVTRDGDSRHYARPVDGPHFETLCGRVADASRTRSKLRKGNGRLLAPDCGACAISLRSLTFIATERTAA